MQLLSKSINPFLFLTGSVYLVLTILTLNNCYFWDVIQQISNEAHWFYETNFSSLIIPDNNYLQVSATGYHPPLMGMMTAILWMIFGKTLWVSHLFTALWAVLLIYSSWKLISILFPEKYVGWVILIILLEPTILSQFVISSPDFILFTAFVICLRAILDKKPILLTIGIFFLCCINMRGLFVGIALFIANLYLNYLKNDKNYILKTLVKTIIPYVPTLLLLISYFTYYFLEKGWFFTDSEPTGHYSMPQNLWTVVAHFLSFILRSVECGRFIIWILIIYFAFILFKNKEKISDTHKFLGVFVLLMNGLYFLFIFISQMPFSPRYFMPQFFVLSILVLLYIISYYETKKIKIFFAVILFFTLTGNFWIYPEKIAKPWDSILSHLPYYELRKECFDYIDNNNFDYNEIAAGFCLYGNRKFIELAHDDKIVGRTDMNKKYFIYSNISNLEDEYIDELKITTKWKPVKTFRKWPVYIIILQNTEFEN